MKRIDFNDDWLWTREFSEELNSAKIKSAALKKSLKGVRLPHSIALTPLNYFQAGDYQMTSGYRRCFKTEKDWENRRVFITFGAAAHEATVFLNGRILGTHSSGYTAFSFELTEFLLPAGKENVLCVRLDSREDLDTPPFGFVVDYMTYGGLYRNVFLEIANENFIDDIFVRTRGKNVTADVGLDKATDGVLKISLLKAGEKKSILEKTFSVNNSKKIRAEFSADEKGVELWSCDEPNLYVLNAELKYGSKLIDSKSVRFGFRDIEMRNDGFYLNGKKFLIRGMNRHQSFPYAGYAMPDSVQKFDADILKKEMGVNAVRTSHYPQSQAFVDRCDELGLLVFTEIPGWQHIGRSEKWRAQVLENTREMVLQYRNHPSVFLWGVRINESPDDDALYEKTNALCRSLDPSRPTGGVRCIKKSHLLEDVYTYNDFIHEGNNAPVSKKSAVMRNANHPYLISEYMGHMFPTKIFDDEIHRTEHALRHAAVINGAASEKGCAGSFAWCFADYNTHKDFGSGDGICYHGLTDMFRNAKTAAAVYSSQQEDVPVMEISSTMDVGEHPASARGKNWIFTNADSVKMFLNDKFITEFKKDSSPFKSIPHGPILIDDFVGNRLVDEEGLSKGVSDDLKNILNYIALNGQNAINLSAALSFVRLLFRGFSRAKITDLYTKYVGNWGQESAVFRFEAFKNGKLVKTVCKGPVERIGIEASVSSNVLREENGYDAASVRISMRDQFGNVLPYFCEPVSFSASGAIEIIGPALSAFRGGVCGTYVRSVQKTQRTQDAQQGKRRGAEKGSLVIKCGGHEKKIEFSVTWNAASTI